MISLTTILCLFSLLSTTYATDANRAATISMKEAALRSVYMNFMFRTDELDSLCITKMITNTHRHEACTITVDCM
jgi:hypothetical protein